MSGVMGMVLGGLTNLGLEQAGNAMNENRRYNYDIQRGQKELEWSKEMSHWNMERQKELWEATGYVAQKDQMKRAGINPALMYGMGGGGGQTAAAAPAPTPDAGSAGQGSNSGGHAMDIGALIQLELLKSQKANIEAQTHKTNVEAEKIAGVDTEEAHTRIRGNNLNNIFNEKSMEDRLDTIYAEMQKSFSELSEQNVKTNVAEATRAAQISKIRQEALLVTAQVLLTGTQTSNVSKDTELKTSQIIKNDKEIQKMAADIEQKWVGLSQDQKRIELEAFGKKIEAALRGARGPLGVEVPILNKRKWVEEVDKILSK